MDTKKIKKMLIISLGFLIFILAVIIAVKKVDQRKFSNNETQNMNENQEASSDYGTVIVDNLRGIDDNDVVLGDKKAPIDIVVYEDLSDSYSVRFNETLNQINENFGNNVVVAFRPYTSKMYPLSMPTYSFVDCAKEQGKFFEARDLILSEVENKKLAEENFIQYGQNLELNTESLKVCLHKQKYIPEIEKLSKEGEDFGVFGSPTIFVNNELVIGARSFNDVENGNGEKLAGMKRIISKYISK
jgi:protein-disulfide isomerase